MTLLQCTRRIRIITGKHNYILYHELIVFSARNVRNNFLTPKNSAQFIPIDRSSETTEMPFGFPGQFSFPNNLPKFSEHSRQSESTDPTACACTQINPRFLSYVGGDQENSDQTASVTRTTIIRSYHSR